MREFFTIAIFKIKADIRMNKTTLNSQKEKHSILSLRRATVTSVARVATTVISIHALLAESDANWFDLWGWAEYFYPRSPCGERLQTSKLCNLLINISIHALLAESDSHYRSSSGPFK